MKNVKDNSQYIGKFLEKDYTQFKTGILELLDDYKRKSERLDKIIKQSDRMQIQLLKANEELDEYKNHLEKKVALEIKRREEKERILLEQSKFAAMGEMIDAIAHQWVQPLSILSMHSQSLEYDFELGNINEEYIKNFQNKVSLTLNHMNSTLNEFRTFFRPDKEKKEFFIKSIIDNTLLFVKDTFIKDNIIVTTQIKKDFKILGIENEYKHILLNILNNSKDAFIANDIQDRLVNIKAYEDENYYFLEISDNAGGIKEEIIDDIFKANFSTKGAENSGIGLYMSSLIAQKNDTLLSVENIKNGAKFILKKEKD